MSKSTISDRAGDEMHQGFVRNAGMYLRPRHLAASAWTGHIPFAGWIMLAARPQCFVELGTHRGASFLAFAQAVSDYGLETRCNAIDTWSGDEHAGFYGDDVINALRAEHDSAYGQFSTLMRMTFDQALDEFADGSVDLLHIDGLHTYEAVRHDFESWLPKLSECGVVLFHDITETGRGFGVWRLWAEIRGKYPTFQFQHAHGLGIALVGARPPIAVSRLASLEADAVDDIRLEFEALGHAIEQQALACQLALQLAGVQEGLDEYRGHAEALEQERKSLVAAAAEMSRANHALEDSLRLTQCELTSVGHQLASAMHGLDEYR
ncbi:MAG: class I SAM-dependent methyltransferase [Thermomonas sp.]